MLPHLLEIFLNRSSNWSTDTRLASEVGGSHPGNMYASSKLAKAPKGSDGRAPKEGSSLKSVSSKSLHVRVYISFGGTPHAVCFLYAQRQASCVTRGRARVYVQVSGSHPAWHISDRPQFSALPFVTISALELLAAPCKAAINLTEMNCFHLWVHHSQFRQMNYVAVRHFEWVHKYFPIIVNSTFEISRIITTTHYVTELSYPHSINFLRRRE